MTGPAMNVLAERNFRRQMHCLIFKAQVDVLADNIQHALSSRQLDMAGSYVGRIQKLSVELTEKLEKEL